MSRSPSESRVSFIAAVDSVVGSSSWEYLVIVELAIPAARSCSPNVGDGAMGANAAAVVAAAERDAAAAAAAAAAGAAAGARGAGAGEGPPPLVDMVKALLGLNVNSQKERK